MQSKLLPKELSPCALLRSCYGGQGKLCTGLDTRACVTPVGVYLQKLSRVTASVDASVSAGEPGNFTDSDTGVANSQSGSRHFSITLGPGQSHVSTLLLRTCEGPYDNKHVTWQPTIVCDRSAAWFCRRSAYYKLLLGILKYVLHY